MQPGGESVDCPVETVLSFVDIIVRNLSGEIVFGPTTLPKSLTAKELATRVLEGRVGQPCTLRLLSGHVQLADDDSFEDCQTDTLEIFAVCEMLELTDQERAEWMCYVQPYVFPDVLASFPEAARADPEVVISAVRRCGQALRHAHATLRANKSIVLEAVRQNGLALQYASLALKKDKEVVLGAVQTCGCALQFADLVLRNDKEVVLQAVRQDVEAFQYASEALQIDTDVTRICRRSDEAAGHADRGSFEKLWCLMSTTASLAHAFWHGLMTGRCVRRRQQVARAHRDFDCSELEVPFSLV
eukprot:TRINITY_DN76272_c0_g1_i1.p1 TRINITY_DN76272_c0_g1~~TRINITY_DN76272_c0_g1_i1.p1  ORF type:complete len:319 (+),score=36.26 TRINITY_DN76272_c0_g1_i1:55-957(+)